MNKTRSPSNHPIAVFSKAEIDKYQKYANFGVDVSVMTDDDPYYRSRVMGQNLKNAAPDASQPLARYQPAPKGGYGIKTDYLKKIPLKGKLLLAAGVGAAAATAGVGGAMFLRRRRTKKGKIVVEQVRR